MIRNLLPYQCQRKTVTPVNMPDLIRIRAGSDGKRWPEAGHMILVHRLSSGPDPFGQKLTQSARTKSDPGRLWRNGTESKSGKLVAGRLHPARNSAR